MVPNLYNLVAGNTNSSWPSDDSDDGNVITGSDPFLGGSGCHQTTSVVPPSVTASVSNIPDKTKDQSTVLAHHIERRSIQQTPAIDSYLRYLLTTPQTRSETPHSSQATPEVSTKRISTPLQTSQTVQGPAYKIRRSQPKTVVTIALNNEPTSDEVPKVEVAKKERRLMQKRLVAKKDRDGKKERLDQLTIKNSQLQDQLGKANQRIERLEDAVKLQHTAIQILKQKVADLEKSKPLSVAGCKAYKTD